MINKLIKYKDLPLEEGKTYRTRFQTGELFTVRRILEKEFKSGSVVIKKIVGIEGIYEKSPHLGICPIGIDRLIPDKIEDGFHEVCSHCGKPIF